MKLLFIFIISGLASCAGPTNPFGGDIIIGQKFEIDESFKNSQVTLSMTPDRQYYNSPYDLNIEIIDPDHDITNFRYEVVYNNRVLNRWYKSEEIRFPKNKQEPIVITFKNLSILPGNINKIAFLYYPAESTKPVIYNLKVPECSPQFKNNFFNIKDFEISQQTKQNIMTLAGQYKYNPSLLAALIAQESSFDPKAISGSRALGLTQITPTAHREVKRFKEAWDIYPKFDQLSFSSIKRKLKKNAINPTNDWRVDPQKSIEGGLIYLDYLKSYWLLPDKEDILFTTFHEEVPETDILLASYNSGATRVKNAIIKNKKHWLSDKKLKEARKYVMNIKSYCYSFNQGIKDEK